MEIYLQIIISAVISVFLFILGYRQTIGAKKERIKVANKNIENTLLRRLIFENFTPSIKGITKLTEGKARDHRVKHKDLLNPTQVNELPRGKQRGILKQS